MTCQECKELMTGALYGELLSDERKSFDEHLSSCTDCSTLYRSLEETLSIMGTRTRPDPDEAFWQSYWSRLEPKLGATPVHFLKRLSVVPPAWAYGIAAVLLLAFGVYLGKTFFRPADSVREVATVTPQEHDTLNAQTLAYLERSKNLLLGVVNSDDENLSDLDRRQEASRQLIQQAYFLKAALNKPDEQHLRQLIVDLEVILLELANLDVAPGTPAVELVRKGVNQRSILLKINLEEMRAAAHMQSQKKNA